MIDARKKSQAGSAASFGVLPCVRSLAVCCMLGGSAGAVLAGPGGPGGGGPQDSGMAQASRADLRSQVQQAQEWQRSAGRQEQRQADPRAYDNRDQRYLQREQEQAQAEAARRNNARSMTADERRDLRRQINEAGQDLYGRQPRR